MGKAPQGCRVYAVLVAALLMAAGIGCGMAAAPQPPSLQLPKPVTDLKAERTGNQVQLTWTMPKETTDNLKLKLPVPVRLCVQTISRECDTVGNIQAAPGKPATFTSALPPTLAQGPLRTITYQVFAQNAQGRAAGASNDAPALAGMAPPQVLGLTAQVVPQGVLLHWQPVPDLPQGTVFEIQRTWLNPPVKQAPASAAARTTPPQKTSSPAIAPSHPPKATHTQTGTPQKEIPGPAQPIEQTLLVHLPAGPAAPAAIQDPGAALDSSIQWGQAYRYTVARVVQRPASPATETVTTQALSMRIQGQPSQPIVILAKDSFPPATPQRLAAVPVSAAMTGGAPAVDLSWSANAEPDFAQYRVYRRDLTGNTAQNATRQQIAPAPGAPANALLVTPAFRDAPVTPGHRYAYSVTAVDTSGNESPPTPEVVVEAPRD
ncbi:MAG: hypothetical protein ACP5EP_10250 [Acidobacteriaceae bacterium]